MPQAEEFRLKYGVLICIIKLYDYHQNTYRKGDFLKLESLTPRDDLHKTEDSFRVYKNYLDDAFKNPKIRNLALSGGLGSGKSSIIRSYDHARNDSKKHFLYVSLMDFSNPGKESNTNDQKQLEYSLLNQIMSCCTERELPEGSISGIPEKFKYLKFCAGCLSALCFAVYMLIFHEQFGKMASILAECNLFRFITDDFRTGVHLGLYLFLGLAISYCAYCILCRCLPFFRLSKLTLKANNAEAEVLMGKDRTILDAHKFELAYALEQIGEKYDYTVVFEDLERLNPDVAVDIMEKLRELNTLTNNHIQANRENRISRVRRWDRYFSQYSFLSQYRYYLYEVCPQNIKCNVLRRYYDKISEENPIRFVYAISEKALSVEYRTKFYDCIIPVVPVSNPLDSREHLQKMLDELDIHKDFHQQLLDALSEAIVDYRMYLTLKNEFSILWDLHTAKKNTDRSKNTDNADACNKATMFAIAAYKVLLPEFFEHALSPQGSQILPWYRTPKEETEFKNYLYQQDRKKTFGAVRALYMHKLLDDCCLRLIVGEQQLMQHWLNLIRTALTGNPTDSISPKLAEQVISAVASIYNESAPDLFLIKFRKDMADCLHNPVPPDQKDWFILVAKSLAVVSRPTVATDWEWLYGICNDDAASKIYFRNCIEFLTISSIVPTSLPRFQNKAFSEWCDSIIRKYNNKEMNTQSGWNDDMANTLVKYLNIDNPLFCDHYPETAAYLINNRSIAEIMKSLQTRQHSS